MSAVNGGPGTDRGSRPLTGRTGAGPGRNGHGIDENTGHRSEGSRAHVTDVTTAGDLAHPGRPAGGTLPAPSAPASAEVDALIEATRQEVARADAKSATLLTVVGLGFTAFSVAGASAVAAPPDGASRWLCLPALAGVCAVAELLLFVLRPVLRKDDAGQLYFATWRHYAPHPWRLAAELSADEDRCRTLIRLSEIVWRKYRLIRWAVHMMAVVLPVMAAGLSVALLRRP